MNSPRVLDQDSNPDNHYDPLNQEKDKNQEKKEPSSAR